MTNTNTRRATQSATGSEGKSRALPAGTNAGLWAFLRQAAVIAGASALAGALAVLFFAQLQGAF